MFIYKGRNFLDQRVDVEPSPATRNSSVKITYDGLLARSGATSVYLHHGHDGWQNPTTVQMIREPGGRFTAAIPVRGQSEINFCFKDAASNWDNNSGWNWATDIHG